MKISTVMSNVAHRVVTHCTQARACERPCDVAGYVAPLWITYNTRLRTCQSEHPFSTGTCGTHSNYARSCYWHWEQCEQTNHKPNFPVAHHQRNHHPMLLNEPSSSTGKKENMAHCPTLSYLLPALARCRYGQHTKKPWNITPATWALMKLWRLRQHGVSLAQSKQRNKCPVLALVKCFSIYL